MIYIIISILISICIALTYMEVRKIIIQRKLCNFPSVKQYPIVGGGYRFFGVSNAEIVDVMLGLYEEMKSTPFYGWFGPFLAICLSNPDDVHSVLNNDDCLTKPYIYEFLKAPTSLISTRRQIWKPHRRALNPTFNMRMLQSYIPLLNEKAKILVDKFEPSLEKCEDLYRIIFIGMMDTIIRTTMGVEMNIQKTDRGEYFFEIIKILMANIQYRVPRFWLRWDFTYSLTSAYRKELIPLQNGNKLIDEIYDERVSMLKALFGDHQINNYLEENKNANVLDKCLQLEREGFFNNENVKDQMRVILLAGMDTSAISVFGTLLLLAIHQNEQKMVVDEMKSVFGTADTAVTSDDLTKLSYLDRVIKETLRLLSPVPFIIRKNSADVELKNGIIPKNSFIFINIMHMHRNPNIWGPSVKEFDPDRFTTENIAKRPPYCFIPFSSGPRNCIGMKYAMISAKITLCHLLRKYKFISDLKMEDIRVQSHLVLEILNENPLRIKNRVF